MALTTRVWGAGKLLLLGGALVLTYVLFAAASMRIALRTREVIVPDADRQSVNEATAALAEAGLKLKVEEARRSDPKVPAGQILTQDPQPGVRTRRERSVKVWVSAGPRSSIVPALIGESERTAQLRVQQDGLELGGDFGDPVGGLPGRRRRRADAAADERGRRECRCWSTAASAAATYVMPDLIGVNGDRAADLLANPRLPRLGRRAIIRIPAFPPASCSGRTRRPGSRSRPGEPISLEVSR